MDNLFYQCISQLSVLRDTPISTLHEKLNPGDCQNILVGGFTWPCNQTIPVILKVCSLNSSSITWESLTNYQVLFQSYLLPQQAVFAGSSGENLWARELPNHNRIKNQIPTLGQWHRTGLREYICVQVCIHIHTHFMLCGILVPVFLASSYILNTIHQWKSIPNIHYVN